MSASRKHSLILIIITLFFALLLALRIYDYLNAVTQTGVWFHPSICRWIIIWSTATASSLALFVASMRPRFEKSLILGVHLACLLIFISWILIDIAIVRIYAWASPRDLVPFSAILVLTGVTTWRFVQKLSSKKLPL